MNGIAEEAVGTLHVLEDSTHASSSCKAEVPDGEHAAHAPAAPATHATTAPVPGATDAPAPDAPAEPVDAHEMMSHYDTDLGGYTFGGKLADRLGADMSGDREDEERRAAEARDDQRMVEAARAKDWKATLSEMSHEERVVATFECLDRRPTFRTMLYELLVYCTTERTHEQAEQYVEGLSEFEGNRQSAGRYIFFLERTGALEERPYDKDGVLVDEAYRQAQYEKDASDDDIDELIVSIGVCTTDVGVEAIDGFNPVSRTEALLQTQPNRRMPTYARILDFCTQPRSLEQISHLLEDDPGLEIDGKTGVIGMQPNAYIGHLDQTGALAWDKGWKTTDGGRRILEEMQAQA